MNRFSRLCVVSLVGCIGVAACTQVQRSEPAIEAPALTEAQPRNFAGLHNVVTYHDGFYSGSVPEGGDGFSTLKRLGVKTIISVDGAEPEVDKAQASGMRYIHLPIGYNGFDSARGKELARAVSEAMKDGPVYIHCHHGKHRSAGAAGAIAVELGWMSTEQAVDRMKVSGTSPAYRGLYQCTSDARLLTSAELNAIPTSFPSIAPPRGLVKSMVEIDEASEHLKAIEKAAWSVPANHPDLVPAAEAGRMADLLRDLQANERVLNKPQDFRDMLSNNHERVQKLEDMLAAGEKDAAKLSAQFKLVNSSCAACHAVHRDPPVRAAP